MGIDYLFVRTRPYGSMVRPKPVKVSKDPHSWKRTWARERLARSDDPDGTGKEYKAFLKACRTERETVKWISSLLMEKGFFDIGGDEPSVLSPGQGYYLTNKGTGIAFGIAGTYGPTSGLNIIASHVDSPRLDLKPIPVAGDPDTGLGFLRTHYYGGIKKYHWVNIPLILRGTIHRQDGSVVTLDDDGIVLVIPDLEPHLSRKAQNGRKLSEGITGEELIALAATGAAIEEGEVQARTDILKQMHDLYGVDEEDLISSDLCLVPGYDPRDLGLDRSMIAAYGQDNRISAFASLRGILSSFGVGGPPARWSMAILFNKEEIGSDGPSGAKTSFFERSVYQVLRSGGLKGSRRELLSAQRGSFCLSSDVKSGINPSFKGVQDPLNAARMGAGVTITKYTGQGGKVSANDASAEMVHEIRTFLNSGNIAWQMQESGRVDEGGGGTVAKFISSRNIDTLDIGIPLLSMHSKYEVASKHDLCMAIRFFGEFCRTFRT